MSVLPFPAGEPGRDLLQQPAVAIRVAERRVREVRPPWRVGARGPPVLHLADVDAAADEIVPGGVDVLDRQEQPAGPRRAAMTPLPKWIEHCEWGGVNWTTRKSSPTTKSASNRHPRLS